MADETGLGKSIIARGVIASAVAELQHDADIDRIDVVYICSSTDLAKQNLQRLNVTGDPHIGITSRLTLLALDSAKLSAAAADGRKKVNLVSFTPGTSFEMGWQTGSQEERQLLHVLLNGMAVVDPVAERASALFFQRQVRKLAGFEAAIARMRSSLGHGPDEVIAREFHKAIESNGLKARFNSTRELLRGREVLPEELKSAVKDITSRMRHALAAASVESLEPDLVILDEFQRFRHLIDPDSGSDASELAHHMFDYPHSKVLLLSATPYKPYTTVDGDADDDHYRDFMTTLKFLVGGDEMALDRIRMGFRSYRQAMVSGLTAADEAHELRNALVPYMTRSERPRLEEGRDLAVRRIVSDVPTPEDLRSYAALQEFSRQVDAPISLEYWKSIPYFASFMDGYRPGERVRVKFESDTATAELVEAVDQLRSIDPHTIHSYGQVDLANARLRAFAVETVDQGWWQLLWVPPSLPYLAPGGVFARFADGSVTKRLIFSAWSGVPTSISSLLSYEAERRMVADSALTENTAAARRAVSSRLDYVLRDERPASMSTLALFWPHPELAELGDPLKLPQTNEPASAEAAETLVGARINAQASNVAATDAGQVWESVFSWPGGWPAGPQRRSNAAAFFLAGRGGSGAPSGDQESGRALIEHAKTALTREAVAEWHPELARLALHGPGNIAYRALARICEDPDQDLRIALWRNAARLANAIRTLFNRMDVMFLLDQLYSHHQPYWHSVLKYCADGNLQAVLDEYCFQLKLELGGSAIDAAVLARIVDRAVEALTLRPSRYTARVAGAAFERIQLTARFALRYGGAVGDSESVRAPEVRNAFNSPFWPFVVASTSVGQEGIDFHWWSHSVTHWNLPSNPVDFEQREGRVNRFGGHAVRKNVASAHGVGALIAARSGGHPWQHVFDRAIDHDELGEFSPWWIYPGSARVERLLVNFPLSREDAQYSRLRDSLTLYRLMLGQPRQEDMLELLHQRGVTDSAVAKLDLRPPPA